MVLPPPTLLRVREPTLSWNQLHSLPDFRLPLTSTARILVLTIAPESQDFSAIDAENFPTLDCPLGAQSHAKRSRPATSVKLTLSATPSPILRLVRLVKTGLFRMTACGAGSRKYLRNLWRSVSYAHVGSCRFKRGVKVRILLAPPASLNCREIPPSLPPQDAKVAHFSR